MSCFIALLVQCSAKRVFSGEGASVESKIIFCMGKFWNCVSNEQCKLISVDSNCNVFPA